MAGQGAIVVGGFVNGLGLVRALAARDIRVLVVTTQPYDVAHRSRFCAEHVRLAGVGEHPERLVAVLRARAASHRGWAVVPSTDEGVAALASCWDELSRDFRLAAPTPDVARVLLDKNAMREAAEAVGIACPASYGAADPAVLTRDDLRFPVVVKPRRSSGFGERFGGKLFFATNLDELHFAITRVAEAGIAADVHGFIAGSDGDIFTHCTYLDARGEPRGGVTIRKLRQSPARFGVARVAEIAHDPAGLRDATIALARRIGLRGVAVAEFKRDAADGVFRFIEINGRSVIYNGLLRRAGLDLAALAWTDYVDAAPAGAITTDWPGVWIHLHADVLHALVNGRREGLGVGDFVAPYRRPKIYGVWSAADPWPFFAEWARTAREATARNFRPPS
jgi:predicted ATP-grasp superfamily ATP-dependent carboligase